MPPPLCFVLEANQQSQLRIVRTGGDMPADREEALREGLCKRRYRENEPSDTQAKARHDLNLSINVCDKLISARMP